MCCSSNFSRGIVCSSRYEGIIDCRAKHLLKALFNGIPVRLDMIGAYISLRIAKMLAMVHCLVDIRLDSWL